MLKASMFNLCTKTDKGNLLVYNTLSGKGVVVKAGKKEELLDRILSQGAFVDEREMDRVTLDKLVRYQILVDENSDEVKKAIYNYNSTVYSDEVLQITIIPTNACNFRCVYCYEHELNCYMNDRTADSILRFLTKNIRKYRYLALSWFGGEPLLNIPIIEYLMERIISLCKLNKVVLACNMTTNGYNLTPQVFSRLTELGIRRYQITIDGTEYIHNKQRPHKQGRDSYGIILQNLRRIKELPIKNFEVGIRINISAEINEKRQQVLQELANSFAGDRRFTMIFEWIRKWGCHAEGEIDISTPPSICKEWYQEAGEVNLLCSDLLTISCGLTICEACKKNGFIIDYDGSVHKCSVAYYDNDFCGINRIGQIDCYGKLSIDLEKEVQWIVNPQIEEKCMSCYLLPSCMGVGCPLDSRIRGNRRCVPYKELMISYLLCVESKLEVI